MARRGKAAAEDEPRRGSRPGVPRARVVLIAWVAVVAILAGLGLGVEDRLQPTTLSVPGTESARGAEIVERNFGESEPISILLRGPAAELDLQGPALVAELEREPGRARVLSPWNGATGLEDLRPDPGTALLLADFPLGGTERESELVEVAEDAVEETVSDPVSAELTGGPVIGSGLKRASLDATMRAELIALPVLFAVLIFVFRSPVAAFVPLLFGGATVFATRGVAWLFAGAIDIDGTAVSVASMVGLALGVDYALLLVSRYREELAAGHPVHTAVATARATAGRTVVFAGVVLGGSMLAPLLLAPGALLTSLALMVLLVVVVSVLNATVAGPALLTVLGHRTERLRLGGPHEPALGPTLASVLRRPLVAAGAVLALVFLLAAPVLAFETGPPDVRQLPPGHEARQAFEAIQQEVGPGWAAPFAVVIERESGPVTERRILRQLARWQRDLQTDPRVETVIGADELLGEAGELSEAGQDLDQSREQLAEGREGIEELTEGLDRAASGSAALERGLAEAAAGGHELAGGAARAREGAAELGAGLSQAAAGASEAVRAIERLAGGAAELARGAERARRGAGRLADGLGEAEGAARSELLPGARELEGGLREGAGSLERLREPIQEAEAQLEEAYEALSAATVGRLDPQYERSLRAVATALAALSGRNPVTGEQVEPGYDGADAELARGVEGLREAAAGAGALADGLRGLADAISRLERGAAELRDGVAELADGGERLAGGASELASRAGELSGGLARLSAGAGELDSGLAALAAGSGELAGGVGEAAARSAELAQGLEGAGEEVEPFDEALADQQRRLRRLDRRSPGFFDSGYFLLAGLDGAVPDAREQAAGTVAIDQGGQALRMVIVPTAMANTPEAAETQRELSARADELGERTGTETALTGGLVDLTDYDQATTERMPLIVAGASIIAFLLLVVILRALLLPLIAVILNLLTVAVAFGVLTLLFQMLPGEPLGGPGFTSAITAAGIFGLVFGLSIDYEVFLLGRMREGYLRSGDADQAIVYGLERTAGVITGAAAIMIGVFAVFATSNVTTMREFGIGLTVAIALDATLIRLVLLPALMRMAGERAWWIPGWLDRRLPRLDVEH